MALAGLSLLVRPAVPADSLLARQLTLAALDRAAVFDAAGQLTLLRRALAADPSYLRAHLEYIDRFAFALDTRREYRQVAAERPTPLLRCLAAYAGAPRPYRAAAVPALEALERETGPSACTTALLGLLTPDFAPATGASDLILERLRRATASFPEWTVLWGRYALRLAAEGREADARGAVREGLSRAEHPLDRALLYRDLSSVLARSDSTEGQRLMRAVAQATQRDGRPGVLAVAMPHLRFVRPAEVRASVVEAVAREHLRLAELGSDFTQRVGTRSTLAAVVSDAGRPREALDLLGSAVRLADSLGWPLLRSEVYRIRGRALTKLGRLDEAERDLRTAVDAATAGGDAHYLAEAYHHLAHVHEGRGRLEEAARVADRFVATTRGMAGFQPRMMSLRDAGLIRWKAGWAASAEAAFAEMVEVVDYQERFHYWAGEYFERIGDLPRAVEYYRRGIRRDPQELSLNLGGLARVFEALGQPDSATAAARAHDSVMSNQLDYPLLPPMLARGGRIAEAIATATAWVRTLTERGNLQGAVRGTIALAEVLQSAGRWPEMRTRAEVAESLARRVSLTEEWMQAERLRGLALTRMGQVDSGLRVLRNAAARADAHPTADGILLTQVALGDALAAAGRVEAALAAFGRAASRVEETMGHLAQDLDRARYRDRQLSPFDGAVRVLLRDSRRSRLQRLAAWSGRRKAASLALATGLTPRPVTHPADAKRPSHWQARLGPGDALVDYLVLDSLVAALVLTSTRAEVVALPIRADTARAMVERLRRPLSMAYAGRVDLARAAYDLALARVLYQRLVEPLNHLVAGTRRWFIVPDGPLHRIPFDALVAGGPADGSGTFSYADAAYLVDQVEIVTLPSADFLPDGPRAHEPGPGARGVLAVGHRAPAVDEELRGIVAAWPAGRVHALSGDSATETAVRALAGDHDVWHFATHARADDREPEASHLRLLADEQHDGYLHLVEISANLKPRGVVVLSACETLAGRLFQGEGLLGLSRAFLAAGAKAVIATQWPVGPASADLMTRFHAALARSAPTAEALRAAKLALRRDPTTAHPFYWAGFVLVAGPGGTADPRPQAAASSAGAPGDTLPELPRLQSARRTTSPQRFPSLDPALSRVRALRD